MAFGKKKKQEEEAKTSVIDADEDELIPPEPPEEQPSPEELRLRRKIDIFKKEYEGVVLTGTDGVRASIQFAIFSELRAVNENLRRLERTLREVSE